MLNKYYVVVAFECDAPMESPENYVESAVAEMRGCYSPDSEEFSVIPETVKVMNLEEQPINMTAKQIVVELERKIERDKQ